MAKISLKELAVLFNELDLRAYSRKDNKAGTIIALSPVTNKYHYMNRAKDATTGVWSWIPGQECQKQPGVFNNAPVDA
ncbi:MAG: hypothetical protein Q8O88_05870 [bacterium]|nr:hypothetical protein [bacterium]